MACPHCGETELIKNGHDRRGAQVYRCRSCRRALTALTATPFSGCRFPPEVVALAVRWYLRVRRIGACRIPFGERRGWA